LAPGTVGSLGALLVALALHAWFGWRPWMFAALAAAITPLAIWSASRLAIRSGVKDPQRVVIDEVAGQWLTLAGATNLNWKSWVAALVLFRAFDIVKPFPVRRLEKLRGGYGIVADDLGAGLFGALVLYAIGWLGWY
jgi:phosphatidylglycerophosphatase A